MRLFLTASPRFPAFATEVPTSYGGYIQRGNWEKIKTTHFAHQLASNFCYLTKTPGYTLDPIVYEWQRKLTAELKKQTTPGAIKRREKKECTMIDKRRRIEGCA